MEQKTQAVRSPFFSRSYGGYTRGQEKFYLEAIGNVSRKRILDPMAGQAFALSRLAYKGADVIIGDINPAQLLLASLRDPQVIINRSDLAESVATTLGRLKRKPRRIPSRGFVDDWVPETIKADLSDYAEIVDLDLTASPFCSESLLLRDLIELRFHLAIILLAAREITCFRTTDNRTWLKKGGLLREGRIIEPVKRALASWVEYADVQAKQLSSNHPAGTLTVRRMNGVEGKFANTLKADVVVTSPPYANRLDYTKLWAPESEILGSIFGQSIEQIRYDQIGSNVVANRSCQSGDNDILPHEVQESLEAIHSDGEKASASYYYPFFRTYAISLTVALRKLAKRVRKKGQLIIFVRDTVRKDVLFPTGTLVSRVMEDQCNLRPGPPVRRIIKSHIGFVRRKSASGGVYGLAQQEWWLSFRRD